MHFERTVYKKVHAILIRSGIVLTGIVLTMNTTNLNPYRYEVLPVIFIASTKHAKFAIFFF